MPLRGPLRDLDLNLLLLFEALMATGQLTAAARRIGLTQSAASQALARLRRTLDDPLFVRGRRGMVPTAYARGLQPRVTAALSVLEEALRGATGFDPERAERRFRIAFGSTGELPLLPRLLERIADAAPQSVLVSLPGGAALAQQRVRGADVDLGFDYAVPTGGSLRSEALGEVPLVVIFRRGHPRLRSRVGPRAFFAERHVVVALGDAERAQVERFIEQGGARRRVLAEASHHASVPALVRQSDALGVVPRALVASPDQGVGLGIAPLPFALPPLRLHMFWHAAFDADPGHRWLRAQVQLAHHDGTDPPAKQRARRVAR